MALACTSPWRQLMLSGVIALALFAGSATAAGRDHAAGPIRAATYNLYVGAAVQNIAIAPGLCELMAAADAAVDQVLANDFAQRADALARVISDARPDVVGVQEAFTLVLSDLAQVPFFFQDYLAMLLSALDANGTPYYAAESRTSLPVTAPADADGDCDPFAPSFAAADYLGTIIDRDVVLCRADVACDNGASANFQVNAAFVTPAGPIVAERGWVSTVATVRGRAYRVVNTHLEVRGSPGARAVQFAQALELSATLDAMSADGLPQVAVGDFNSDDDLGPVDCGPVIPCFSGYQVMLASGFVDAWTVRHGPPADGATCCQDEDLMNAGSLLTDRIDHVWVRPDTTETRGPRVLGVRAEVIGDEQSDRSDPDGLWPSDHAGVVADLVIR